MEIAGYRIDKPIGEGGMATAYLAEQESLGRMAVLKVLNTLSRDSKENVERFLNEGRIVASLNHPHIITIYDIGIAEDFMFISMEYIEGGDLRKRIKQGITPEEAIDIVKKLSGGLETAHRKGIVHRDVKPGNILFRKDGTPLLTDFGIAKQLTMDHELTSTGVFLGSPNYMAPEQAEDGPIDGRADIYALGIIFYEMLTGKKPYTSDSVIDVIVQHKQAPIPVLPTEVQRYQPLLNLMMAKDRKNRFRDANSIQHFIHHLEKMEEENRKREELDKTQKLDEEILETEPVYQSGFSHHGSSKKRWSTYVLGALLMISASGFGLVSYMNYKLNEELSTYGTFEAGKANLDASITLAPIPKPGSAGIKIENTEELEELHKALGWLARKSLEEYRLTAPPKDNAYYYYVRLLDIDPDDQMARQGMIKIAESFAYLAEKGLAENNHDLAIGYINLGLQINPENKVLKDLRELTTVTKRSFIDKLMEFFSS